MRLFLPALVLALIGCAPQLVRDDSPKRPTAIVQTHVSNLGFKGLFASESSHTDWTRADRRRSEDEFKFTGFFMKRVAKAHDDAVIWRIDRGLLWRLSLTEKLYAECPLSGCVEKRRPAAERPRPEQRESQPERKPTCALSIAKNSFTVTPTSESREINGFPTKKYKAVWEVVAKDAKGRKDTSLLGIDIWTTPESDPRIVAARQVERTFEAALHAARPPKELDKGIPPEAMKVIAAQFLGRLTAGQRQGLLDAGRELAKVKGHPILTKLEWRLDGDACGEAADAAAQERSEEKPSLDITHGIGGLLGSAGGMAAHKVVKDEAERMKEKPVFGFELEVKRMEVAPASDGLFSPPPDFRKR